MKAKILVLALLFICFKVIAQDSINKKTIYKTWFDDHVKIRKTFDGSKNEKKPATLNIVQNNKSGSSFSNVDFALKVVDFELLDHDNILVEFFPVFEWHKSSKEGEEKDKVSLQFNTETTIEADKIQPYILTNVALKRNFIDKVYELKFVGQLSFDGIPDKNSDGNSQNKEFYLPGVQWRFNNEASDYKGMYYPYIGYEFDRIPNLFEEGETENISIFFIRLFIDYWLFPRQLQFIVDTKYRRVLNRDYSKLKKDLPILDFSFNYYPAQQKKFSIGLNYRTGYDSDIKYQNIETTSISINVNF